MLITVFISPKRIEKIPPNKNGGRIPNHFNMFCTVFVQRLEDN